MRPRLGDLWAWAERHADRAVAAGIAVATLARLAYVTYLGDDLGGPDSDTYDEGGWDLARRGPFSSEITGLPYFPPGYALVVGLHYRVAGRHPYAVKLSQVALVAVLSWLTYKLADRVAGPRPALVTGLGMSASLAWLALPHPLMYEPWMALLFVLGLLLLLDGRFVAAGLAFGGACVFQDKTLTLLPFFVLSIGVSRRDQERGVSGGSSPPAPQILSDKVSRRRKAADPRLGKRWRDGLLLVVASLLVIAPFAARNLAVYGEPIVLASNHGVNLLIGNNPTADGSFTNIDRHPPSCPGIDVFSSEYLATDRALIACAVRRALADPLHELRILPSKFARFWATFIGPWAEINNWRHHLDFREAFPDRVLESQPFGAADRIASTAWVLGSLTLLGIGFTSAARRAPREAWLVFMPIAWLTATHLVTFGDPRYRIPVLPLVWLLQANGLVTIMDARRGGRGAGGSSLPRGTRRRERGNPEEAPARPSAPAGDPEPGTR